MKKIEIRFVAITNLRISNGSTDYLAGYGNLTAFIRENSFIENLIKEIEGAGSKSNS
jgi:hypothetical protein